MRSDCSTNGAGWWFRQRVDPGPPTGFSQLFKMYTMSNSVQAWARRTQVTASPGNLEGTRCLTVWERKRQNGEELKLEAIRARAGNRLSASFFPRPHSRQATAGGGDSWGERLVSW